MPAIIKGILPGINTRLMHIVLKTPSNNYITTMTRGNSYVFYDIKTPGKYRIYEVMSTKNNTPSLSDKIEIGFVDIAKRNIDNNEIVMTKKSERVAATDVQLSTATNDANLMWKYNGVDYSDVSNQVETNITLPPPLEITKDVNLTDAVPGDILTYTINLNNPALVDATSTILIDTVPEGTSFVVDSLMIDGSTIPGANPNPPSGVDVGTVPAGTNVEITFKASVEKGSLVNEILNDASVTFDYGTIPLGNNSNQTVTTTTIPASLLIVKSVDKTDVEIGDTLLYTIKIDNPSAVDATDIILVDSLPSGTSFVVDSLMIDGATVPGANPQPPDGVNIGTVSAGSSTNVTFSVKVNN